MPYLAHPWLRLWLSVHFSEHTMAAFLFKCMEEVAFGSPHDPTTPHPIRVLAINLIHDIVET